MQIPVSNIYLNIGLEFKQETFLKPYIERNTVAQRSRIRK